MPSQFFRSSSTKRTIATGLVSLVLFGATQLSHASTFTLNTSGLWTNYVATDISVGAVVSGLNTTKLSWGDTPALNDPQSSLTFTATSFGSGQGPLLNSVFTLGTLTHSNNVIDIATGITSAKLSLNLNFGATSTFIAPIYDFNILETPNTVIDPLYPLAGCAAWQSSLTPCDDKISLSSLNQGKQFTLNGQLYSFNLLGFSNGEGYSSDMITSENVDTTRNLMASITAVPTPVPVPSALWLLGSGLLGLAGFAKRKRIPQ